MISNILHTSLKRKCLCASAALGNCPEQHFFHYLPSATFLSFCRSPITLAQILQPLCFRNLVLHLQNQHLQLLLALLAGVGMLYHKNTEFRASDAASAIRGYHNQHIRFQSLLQYFTYITSHDAYRMHHLEAPRAALTKKPPKQKEPPRKGTKSWHKEQTRRKAAERRRAIRNVLELIDSLDAGYTARPAV